MHRTPTPEGGRRRQLPRPLRAAGALGLTAMGLLLGSAGAFVPPRPQSLPAPGPLQMALRPGRRGGGPSSGRGGGGGGGGKQKKKNAGRKRTGAGPGGKHRKTTKRDDNGDGPRAKPRAKSSTSTQSPRSVALPSDTARGQPPWQVMSKKDAKRNIRSEVERRERIGLGLDRPSDNMPGMTAAAADHLRADVSRSNALLSESDRSLLSWKRFNPDQRAGGIAYIGSFLGRSPVPPLGVPEVAFLGRSNVGKSSLFNSLTKAVSSRAEQGGPADRARVGKTPGATAAVNLYAVVGQRKRGGSAAEAKPLLGLADLPGFGYAKLSKDTKAAVEEAAERYLGRRRELALGILLVDARRTPSADDRAVLAALYDMDVPIVVGATKVDKLSVNELGPALETVREGLGLPDGQPLCVSSVTGEGTKDLWRIILDAAETRVEELAEKAQGLTASETAEDGDDDEAAEFFDDEEYEYDQGYEWAKSYGLEGQYEGEMGGAARLVGEDDLEEQGGDDYQDGAAKASRWKMDLNEQRQAAENESLKLSNLKKQARRLQRKGEL